MENILDIAIIILLVIAMVYGFALNRRISLIQDSKRDLAKLFKTFDATIFKAQTSIEELRKISSQSSQGLQKQIDKALLLYDDLSFLNERADKIADKMEKIVKASKIRGNDLDNDLAFVKPEKASTNKQILPENNKKDEYFKQKQLALEKLLVKVSESRIGNENSSKVVKKDDKVVVDALKVLGYGKNNK